MRTGIEFDDGRFDRAKLGFVLDRLLTRQQTLGSSTTNSTGSADSYESAGQSGS